MKAYMTLSCRPSVFNTVLDELAINTVLDELMKMDLSMKDVFLLFGPVDILVQLHFNSLDEFINKWFNPIRAITPKEPMIEKTETLFVLSEGRSYDEEPYAFLFLNTQPRNIEQVQHDLQSIPNVLSADIVFGPYDFICAVKASDVEDLKRLVLKIQKEVSHIQGTVTGIVASLH